MSGDRRRKRTRRRTTAAATANETETGVKRIAKRRSRSTRKPPPPPPPVSQSPVVTEVEDTDDAYDENGKTTSLVVFHGFRMRWGVLTAKLGTSNYNDILEWIRRIRVNDADAESIIAGVSPSAPGLRRMPILDMWVQTSDDIVNLSPDQWPDNTLIGIGFQVATAPTLDLYDKSYVPPRSQMSRGRVTLDTMEEMYEWLGEFSLFCFS